MKSGKAKETSAGDDNKGKKSSSAERVPSPAGFRRNGTSASSVLRCRQQNLSSNASCSSDASTDSSHSRASTGKIRRRSSAPAHFLNRRIEKMMGNGMGGGKASDDVLGASLVKKRCPWVTSNTDPIYAAFHDEEWGLPIHNDKKLFELFSYSTALAELSWPAILGRRHIFRDVFLEFDPVAVSKLQDKKVSAPGSPASSLLSELRLRSIIENSRQICKIIDEYGSFDNYIWGFVSFKPIVGNFCYPRQVPIKTSKAETISKDLVKRGLRGAGPTVVYSFMQAAGLTNDHIVNCFRYRDCVIAGERGYDNEGFVSEKEAELPQDLVISEVASDMDNLNLYR